MMTDWYWNDDAEGRNDIIRMDIEAGADPAYYLPWTQEVSDMYAELDMKDCD